jgi:hypothetical protein
VVSESACYARQRFRNQSRVQGLNPDRRDTFVAIPGNCLLQIRLLGPRFQTVWRNSVAALASHGGGKKHRGTDNDNAGLLAFKNHWVSAYERLLYWRFPARAGHNMSESWKLKMVKHLFSHMPQALLVMSGRLVYRHIG